MAKLAEDVASFRRAFYSPPRVAVAEAEERRSKLGIDVHGDSREDCPPPIHDFEELGLFPDYLLRSLRDQGISKPMPIQAQALPLVLSGRDTIGLAQTGSGKTLAFLLPAVVHMEAQNPVDGREPTPMVLVLAPVRELAVQIAEEAEKILWHSQNGNHRGGLHSVCLYGGGNKHEQKQKLRQGCQVLVATPGRLLDFLDSGWVSLRRVTFFVLDEADRMLDLGFLGDVDAISKRIRPDRQVLFFSATWSTAVQELAQGLCNPHGDGPVRISSGQGSENKADGTTESRGAKHQAREGIDQRVVVVDDSAGDWKQQVAQKRNFLERYITSSLESSEDHKLLVFVSQKQVADDLSNALHGDGFAADSMHGGKSQENRLWVLDQFRKGKLRLLVCTDVIGRGIDLPDVSHVVIYEMGSIDEYIHRIGRTGRGPHGKGQALVLFEYWDKQPEVASDLIEVLRASDQPVPEELKRIAMEVASGKRGAWNKTWSKEASWSTWQAGESATTWGAKGKDGFSGGYAANSGPGVKNVDGAPGKSQKATSGAATTHDPKNKATKAVEKQNVEVPDSWDVPDNWDD